MLGKGISSGVELLKSSQIQQLMPPLPHEVLTSASHTGNQQSKLGGNLTNSCKYIRILRISHLVTTCHNLDWNS